MQYPEIRTINDRFVAKWHLMKIYDHYNKMEKNVPLYVTLYVIVSYCLCCFSLFTMLYTIVYNIVTQLRDQQF